MTLVTLNNNLQPTNHPGLKRAISELKTDWASIGFILDLRNNPGGLLNQAISVSDIFLNQGEIVSTEVVTQKIHHAFMQKQGPY